ncbi:MAG TPA: galactose oxidase-like domain-containing protein, partial [Verrucomicrobiae bacterium]|nr:galactose oxidase-like domain-containing protein [Verrucomicrobiae bacterium]
MYFYRTQSAHQTCVVSKSLAAQLLSGSARQNWGIAAIALLLFCAPLAHGQANVTGTWQTLPTLMPINPVHTALLSNGKILVVSGSGNYTAQTTYLVGLWDPSNNSWTNGPQQSWDMFCNGMIVLPDGRAFIVGGNLQYDPFFGWKRTSIYDPVTAKYADMEDMAHGRWYPTDTVLGDGRVMTFSGLDETGNTNSTVEIYKVGAGWSAPLTASWTPPLYPRMHVLPSGKVFYSGWTTQSRTFDPSTNSWSGVIATTNYGGVRNYGSSVLFPLTPANGYKPKVIIFGGGNPSTATTEVIDLSATTPSWVYGPSMSQPRIEMNATMLPNGQILTVGGSVNDEDTSTASLQADLYDTATNTMSSAGSNSFARLYHSVALLLPDATVWVAGGNPSRGSYEQHVEIYTPPYLYNSSGSLATRPSITSVTPGVIGYGSSFQVQTPDAANIASVVIMKDGSVTHAFNMDQRLVGLSFTAGSGVLNVTGPPNGNTAPPGYYMIFLINTSGVPSVAKFVQISKTATDTPPKGTITSPISDIVIAPGQSVTFSGTGTASSGSISAYSWSFRGATPATSSLQNPGAVTFSTAGTYTASFTVTDSAGNTDPSPPVRTITVASEAAPVLSAVSPTVGGQGTSNLSVTLSGSNFLPSPTCGFGSGITVNSCTQNSSTQITANINILSSAVIGSRNVTVTNTDGQSSTLNNSFTVQTGSSNPAPTITNVSPNAGLQGQSNITVTITGTNFLPNPSCNFDAEQGLTVSACNYNSATKITATLSITSTATVGGHNVVITDSDGQSATAINGFTVNSSGVGFGGGFGVGSMALNGNATISGTALSLTTTNGTFQASSAWYPTPINIQNFTTDFSFQTSAGTQTADGLTFTLQNGSTAALGSAGGSLGYATAVTKSVAVKFDLYNNSGEGPDSTGLYVNGASPTTPASDMTSSGINLHNGDVFRVHMTYDGTTLTMTITDASTAATFTQAWTVNIPSTVQGNTAYAGFTGATGGYTSNQNILSWTMSSSG